MLASLQPGASGAAPRIVVLPAPSLPAPVPATAAPAARSRLAPLIGAVARRLLRSPRAKRLVLAILVRVPPLHARAVRMLFAPTTSVTVDAIPLAPALAAILSPRARLAARRLQQVPPAPGAAPLPAPGDAAGWDRLVATLAATPPQRTGRPRMAFVSPLPPERTGIADYAVQLLPALCAWFDIELVVQQDQLELPPELAGLPVRDAAWLRANAHACDQILYQIGNSEFHSYMFALLRDHPGVVVLHDFFLGNVMAYRQLHNDPPGAWTGALFHAHGYRALHAYQQAGSRPALLKSHPCNLAVIEQASAVIVHSSHAAELARTWYGADATHNWHTVPLPRAAPPGQDRAAARAALGIGADMFVVCSFGYIGQNKLTDRLLAAWLASTLHGAPHCLLVLVGANHNSPFGNQIAELVRAAGGSVRIAGWSDDTVYRQYLQAADVGVQLRTSAQGETSAAVLDCMNYGLPTIVNANGSMAALPPDAVLRLPDVFEDSALTAALEALHGDTARRTTLGHSAAHLLATAYRPEQAAARYAAVLGAHGAQHIETVLGAQVAGAGDAHIAAAAAAIARRPDPLHVRQLLLHAGANGADDGQLRAALLDEGPIRVELVSLHLEDGAWRIRYARTRAAALLGMVWEQPDDPLADLGAGDVFYSPALPAAMDAAAAAHFCAALRAHGVTVALAAPATAPADVLVCRDAGQAAALQAATAP
jgi:glycosyltransferase involved in cell wall biosynthesis